MKTPAAALLVVIAALLAANLFVSLPPQEAQAHPPDFVFDPQPTVVGMAAYRTSQGWQQIFRIWSDGMVEENRFGCLLPGATEGEEGHLRVWCGWETVPE